MVSIVIRNKNESVALEKTLSILQKIYFKNYSEIIIVDNNSTDNSIEVANKYNCKVLNISDFSYGRATNLGIEATNSQFVLLLSAHAIPIGNNFFINTILATQNIKNLAGIRYINSFENYERAIKNNFVVQEPLKYGLMTACALINKEIWNKFKFDEDLVFSEDKEWSNRVVENGFKILDINETFFYFIKRNQKSELNRFKNETISEFILHKKKYMSVTRILISFLKTIVFNNNKTYFQKIIKDFQILKTKLEISKFLKHYKSR